MAISIQDFLRVAVEHKPDLPIKEVSTWIAVVLHTVNCPEDITDSQDFLWMKCHKFITIRTMKHKYFTRYPLEEIAFGIGSWTPPEEITVGDLQARCEIEHNIIVIRAYDVTNYVQTRVLGRPYQNAVDLSSEESAEDTSSDAGSEREHGYASEDEEACLSKDDGQDLDIMVIHSTKFKDDEGWPTLRTRSSKRKNEGETAMPESPAKKVKVREQITTWDPATSLEDMRTKSEHDIELFTTVKQWHRCEVDICGKEMHIRPWTRKGLDGGPLCTNCTRSFLEHCEQLHALTQFEELRTSEYLRKTTARNEGRPQNFDHDAPLDHPADLHDKNDLPIECDVETPVTMAEFLLEQVSAAQPTNEERVANTFTEVLGSDHFDIEVSVSSDDGYHKSDTSFEMVDDGDFDGSE